MHALRVERLCRRHVVSSVLIAQCWIVASLVCAGLLRNVFVLELESAVYLMCVLLGGQSLWSIWSWRIVSGRLFDPYIIFLGAAILFNAGQVFLEIFQLNSYGLMNGVFSAEITLETVYLVSLGLAVFHLGALAGILSDRSDVVTPPHHRTGIQPEDLRTVGWLLLSVSIIPTLMEFRNALSVVISSGYFGLYQQEVKTSFDALTRVLATFLVPASLFLLAGNNKNRAYILLSIAVIAGYVLTEMFLGARAKAALPLIAYAWLWHRHVRPIPTSWLVSVGLILLVVAFPLLAAVRNVNGIDRLSLGFLVDAYLSIENPAIAALTEMGGTMKTVAYTLDLVPYYRPFDMGSGYFYALLTVVPNLFWDVHPSIAHGLPSDWLIWMVDPYQARLGGGFGFSFIAEAYLNFGWFGAPLALGVVGLLYARLILWSIRDGNLARMTMLACFVSFFPFYVRQEASSQIRILVWYSILPYFGAYLIYMLRSRRWG